MARRGAPALYELMRQPGGSAPAARPAAVGSARHGQAPGIPDSFTISFARLDAVAVGVVVAIAIAYGIGVQRGRSSVAAAAPSQGTAKADSGGPSGGPAPKIPALGGKSGSAPSAPPKASATDNNGDPRVKGMRYFVLGHPASERAAEMVEFCRLNGLDAYLVPDNTALLRKVIVLPGYADAKDKASPEIKALEAKIRSVGEKWKKTAPRINKDFSEAFPEKFQ
jgi:hypothetical protein